MVLRDMQGTIFGTTATALLAAGLLLLGSAQ